jgi:O-antigen/teichoic acid export membrane protein
MKTSQRVIKNVLLGGLGTAISTLLQLAAVSVIARILTIRQFGVYSLLIALTVVLDMLPEAGIGNVVIRDLAIAPQNLAELFGSVLSLQWTLCFVVGLLMAVVVPLLHLTFENAVSIFLMGLAALLRVRARLYGALLRSQEDHELQGLGFGLFGVVLFLAVLVAAKLHLGLVAVCTTYVLSYGIQVLCFRRMVLRRYERPALRWNFSTWKYLLANSLPIGAAASGRALGEQTDLIALSWFTNLRTVGLYGGPYKIAVAIRYLPQPLVFALFPLYSRAAVVKDAQDKFGQIYERTMRTLLLGALPLAVLFLTVPRLLAVGLLGRHFAQSAGALQLLGIVAMLFIMTTPFPPLLTALAQERFLLVSTLIAAALRVVANLTLIPFLGLYGACGAAILSETVLLGLWIGRLSVLGFPLSFEKILWRPLLGSMVLALILHYAKLRTIVSLAGIGGLGGILYLALMLVLGAFTEDELRMAREGIGFIQPFWEQSLRALKRKA